MKKWLRRKLRKFLQGDDEAATRRIIKEEMIELLEAIETGRASHWYFSYRGDITRKVGSIIEGKVTSIAQEDIHKRVKEVVDALDINKEEFLDKIIARIQVKQVK